MRFNQITRNQRNIDIINIFAVIIGSVVVVIAIFSWINDQQFMGTAIHVIGTVSDISTKLNKGTTVYSPVVKFTTTDGQDIVYRSNDHETPSSYSIGQQVDIYYDPANPHSVLIGGPTDTTLILGGGGMGAFFALLGLGSIIFRIVRRR